MQQDMVVQAEPVARAELVVKRVPLVAAVVPVE
jgi:hypothetical protein